MTPNTTVVIVAYGVTELDLGWVPPEANVVVVHNDMALSVDRCAHPRVRHLYPGKNLGFGAGVNCALEQVTTERVLLCNPDTLLDVAHFRALDVHDDRLVVAVPLVEDSGRPNVVVSGYWSVPAFLATAFRLGRLAPRGGRALTVATRVLGSWGKHHREALVHTPGEWPVAERWVSGAVLSLPTAALRLVGGFDEDYFLYFEDADLHQRLARAFPDMRARLCDVEPAHHAVGGTVTDGVAARTVERHRRRSARTYASRQRGVSWRVAEAIVGVGAS